MKKQFGENNLKKGGIAEELAMMKQRREARKVKEEQKKILNHLQKMLHLVKWYQKRKNLYQNLSL